MARRKASRKKSSSLLFIILGGLVLLGIFIILALPSENAKQASSEFPIEEYMKRGSTLRDNQYTITGRVENQDSCDYGELITIVVNTGKNQQARLPIIVNRESKSMNIEREQSYAFTIIVENKGNAKGLLMATKIALP